MRFRRQNNHSSRRRRAKDTLQQLHQIKMTKVIDPKGTFNSIFCLSPIHSKDCRITNQDVDRAL